MTASMTTFARMKHKVVSFVIVVAIFFLISCCVITIAFVPAIPSTRRTNPQKSTSHLRPIVETRKRSLLWANAIDTQNDKASPTSRTEEGKIEEENEYFFDIPSELENDTAFQQHHIASSFLTTDNNQQQEPAENNDVEVSSPLLKTNHQLTEYIGLGTWITALSSFLLINNYVGPFPANLLSSTPVKAFGLTHAVSGMLFGGGIILTTLLEWLAVGSKSSEVLQFYFDKVPKLDSFVVLPALTLSILSGVGLAVDHYGSLGDSPMHVVGAISTLLAFAIWWAVTDVTTQGAAQKAISEWAADNNMNSNPASDVPEIVQKRKVSNVVSCLFVLTIYGFMVLKPGYIPP